MHEISHRKLNFAMGLLSVAVAVGCFVGAKTLLDGDEIRTVEILAARTVEVEQAVAAKQADVEAAGRDLEDAMRKITKGLGFNLLILPEDQDVNELYTEGTLSKSMPDEFVERLANSKIMTINHLLPLITRKLRWEELGQTVYVIGTRGEVPLVHRDLKKPLQDHVPPGTMVVGFQVAKQLGLEPDKQDAGKNKAAQRKDKNKPPKVLKTVKFQGREFDVTKAKAELGNRDDSTVWINLGEAQELFDSNNLVNAILALECNCATADRVTEIRQDLERILPGTQVIESGPPALARAEARNKAKAVAVESLRLEKEAGAAAVASESESRARLETQHRQVAGILVPLAVVGCAVWIGLLTFGNVRQRAGEIGILRAIGLRSAQILFIFLGKAVVIGVLGATIGCVAGFAFGAAMGDLSQAGGGWSQLFEPQLFAAVLLMTPIIAALASWIPAVLASRQDPAVILQAD